MTDLVALRALQREFAALEERKLKLQANEKLQAELEFEEKLFALIAEFGYSKRKVVEMLNPPDTTVQAGNARKPREEKTYRNPNSGETVVTKGANHRTLNQWRESYGAATVASWIVS
ncbi:DNA binding protein [Halopseudomonas nanhaiensis]|uniref:histone-like nucleoid-structuring protein, MvaT/MvaU family n=1 Tax=Halopseudomonas nanhaiensis TaxID=2830842 RepID=UPI001CBD381F|nr:histone-like nucleoid-structuring protein, MvaT/MvaU family [Halopseudomonas nanhaiensis]UAW98634.1 DNA binding protein [Halopseudomonas nanhaiensis]